MHVSWFSRQQEHAVVTVILVMTLLLAQWAGLAHRIDHAYSTGATQVLASTVDGSGTNDASLRHSCVAFDAAAVADSLHVTAFALPIVVSAKTLALWAAFSSWDAPVVCHFSSRAPPLA